MAIDLGLPKNENCILTPRLSVIGVGGAGCNAVNNMVQLNMSVDTASFNTDAQALKESVAKYKLQLGPEVTSGLGAGSSPEMGRQAAEESREEIIAYLQNHDMVFITSGMGGGTGTGAGPVIASIAKEMDILTVGVVTKPFHFEGDHRMKVAELGLEELHKYVDTLIVIPNQNLFLVSDEETTFAGAFKLADDVLYSGVRGITDLIIKPGLINLDFADIRSVMSEMGKAMMGTGESEGKNRAIDAAEAAISNPLLDNISMKGAKGMLINIMGGMDMKLYEVDAVANRIRTEVDVDANIIFGSTFSEDLDGRIRVSVVATGIDVPDRTVNLKEILNSKEEVLRNREIFSPSESSMSSDGVFNQIASAKVGYSVENDDVFIGNRGVASTAKREANSRFSRSGRDADVDVLEKNPENDIDIPAFLRRRKH